MSKSQVKHYYKQKAEIADLEVEYDSEAEEITIGYTKKFGPKPSLGYYMSLRIPPMYIDALCELLKEVAPKDIK